MKKQPLFKKTFISFIVFLFLVVFIIGLIFNYSVLGYMEDEISKSGIGKLKVAKNNNDLLADSVIKNAVSISLSPYVDPALSEAITVEDGSRSAEKQMLFRHVFDTLFEIERTNNGIHSIYLYVEDAGFVFSTKTGTDRIENFCDTKWLEDYNKNKAKGITSFWLPSRTPDNRYRLGGSSNTSDVTPDYSFVISYVYSLTAYTTQLQGAIVINLYESRLSNLINSRNQDDEGYIYVLDAEGNVVSHVDKTLLGGNLFGEGHIKEILDGKEEEGYTVLNSNKVRQLNTYYKSDLNGWVYIGVFPLDTIMHRVQNLRVTVLVIMTAIVLIFAVTAYFVVKRLYSPVRKLIQDIKTRKGIDIYGEKNEVSILSKAFDTIIKQDNQLYSALEKSRTEIRDSYLMGLLSGTNQYRDMDLNILKFKDKYYFCLVAAIDRYKDFSANFSEERQYYLKTLIVSIFEEVLNRDFICYGLQIENDRIAIIVNTPKPDYECNLKLLRKELSIIQQEILKVLDNTITISIGRVKENISGIRASFSEALDFLKLRLISGHGSVISYREERFDERDYNYPFTLEKHILNNLNIGSKSGILSSVEEFLSHIKANNELSYDNTVLMLNQLLASTVRYLLDSNIHMSQVFGNSFDIYRQFLDNETLDDIGLWLGKIYVSIIEHSSTQKPSNRKYIDEAIEYIHKNYKSDLDINALAEKLGISYSQLRRTFIKEKGDNMVDYINKLRINEAKRLLLLSNESIAELAVNLGYSSDRNFTRFFRKYEGITPGEFRRALK